MSGPTPQQRAQAIFDADPARYEFALSLRALRRYGACSSGREEVAYAAGERFRSKHALPLAHLARTLDWERVDWMLDTLQEKNHPLAAQLLLDVVRLAVEAAAAQGNKGFKRDAGILLRQLALPPEKRDRQTLDSIYERQDRLYGQKLYGEDEIHHILLQATQGRFSGRFGDLEGNCQEALAELIELRIIPQITPEGELLVIESAPTPPLRAGVKVRVLDSLDASCSPDIAAMIGEVCEVRDAPEDEDMDGDDLVIEVWTADKQDYWYFRPNELEIVTEEVPA